MQFVAEGPLLPPDLLEAHEAGCLALFCGAGISVPAGLPLFKGLVEAVRDSLTPQLDVDDQTYDHALRTIETEAGPQAVQREVARLLSPSPSPDLSTHQALIDVSRDPAGVVRLITTNFDRLFELADERLPSYSAPALPVPKAGRWEGIVHLHGSLSSEPTGVPSNLVLTSADFGIAYLVEAWASRFFTELVRNYAVLFIGYQADDPVMRYLCDALDAERQAGRAHGVFAMAPSPSRESDSDVAADWEAKRIRPIVYRSDDNHRRLHETLKSWATEWKGGQRARQESVRRIGVTEPRTAPTHHVRQLCRYVERSPALARTFAGLNSEASIHWLRVLEAEGVLEALAENPSAQTPLVANQPPPRSSVSVSQFHIANWLSHHLDKHELVAWVLQKGGVLHPRFADQIRKRLRKQSPAVRAFRDLWLQLVEVDQVFVRNRWIFHETLRRIEVEPWSASLQLAIVRALEPKLDFRPRWGSDPYERGDVADTVANLAWVDCKPAAGMLLPSLLSKLAARETWRVEVVELSIELVRLLGLALTRMESVGRASTQWDASRVLRPDIASGPTHGHADDWAVLIDLLVASLEAANDHESPRLRVMVALLETIPFPAARRLLLHSNLRYEEPSHGWVMARLIADPPAWLWSLAVQREVLTALPLVWGAHRSAERSALAQEILNGPPRVAFRANLPPNQWSEIRDEMIWERLRVLEQTDTGLPGEAAAVYAGLSALHPEWSEEERLRGTPSNNPIELHPARVTVEEMRHKDAESIVEIFTGEDPLDIGNLASLEGLFAAGDSLALKLLCSFTTLDDLPERVWKSALAGLRASNIAREDPRRITEALGSLPSAALRAAPWEVAEILSTTFPALSDQLDADALKLWQRTFDAAEDYPAMDSDPLTAAINHPGGKLVGAVLETIRGRAPEASVDGIPTELAAPLDRTLSTDTLPAKFGRVIIASRLPLLHSLDDEWTNAKVVPLFSWAELPVAAASWQGFFWSPFLTADLWNVLRPHFLTTFEHLDRLPDRARESAFSVLASILVERPDWLEDGEARHCLRLAEDHGQAIVLTWMRDWLDRRNDGDLDAFWEDRLARIFRELWPGPNANRPRSSSEMAEIVAKLVDSFPAAVETIVELLTHAEWAYSTRQTLAERGHLARFPEAGLVLLNAITPDHPDPSFRGLLADLRKIESADASLAERPEFRRLMDIAINEDL